jgi:hypothetical protein
MQIRFVCRLIFVLFYLKSISKLCRPPPLFSAFCVVSFSCRVTNSLLQKKTFLFSALLKLKLLSKSSGLLTTWPLNVVT